MSRYANDLLAPQGLTLKPGLVVLEVLRRDGCSAGQLGKALDFDSASLAGLLVPTRARAGGGEATLPDLPDRPRQVTAIYRGDAGHWHARAVLVVGR